MIQAIQNCVTCTSLTMDFPEAKETADCVGSIRDQALITIDLSAVALVTTAAFAMLIDLRGRLRRMGRDLRLKGIHDKALALHRMLQLHNVLPLL